MKTSFIKTTLSLAALWLLGGGGTVWADDTWDFSDNTKWTDEKLTANKMYNTNGEEVQSGGVTLNFESEKASFDYRNTKALWFKVDGNDTQPSTNYVQVVVPANHRLTTVESRGATFWDDEEE